VERRALPVSAVKRRHQTSELLQLRGKDFCFTSGTREERGGVKGREEKKKYWRVSTKELEGSAGLGKRGKKRGKRWKTCFGGQKKKKKEHNPIGTTDTEWK